MIANLIEVVALALVVVVAVVAVGILALIARRIGRAEPNLLRSQPAPERQIAPAPSQSQPTQPDELPTPPDIVCALDTDDLLDRYYVDLANLESLAAELGIPVDPVKIEQSIRSSDQAQLGAQLAVSLDVPTMASVSVSAGGEANRFDEHSSLTSTQQRVTIRGLLGAICRSLWERHLLITNLFSYPDSEIELRLANLGLVVKSSWNLPLMSAIANAPAEGDTPPQHTPEEKIALSIDAMLVEATRRIYEAKLDELRLIGADSRQYVLVSADWVRFTPGGAPAPELWASRLEAPADNTVYPNWLRLPRYVVRTSIANEHLTADGRAQLLPQGGPMIHATLFGKVATFDTGPSVLTITPLAIYG